MLYYCFSPHSAVCVSGAFLDLSFGEEGIVPIQVSSLRDRSSLLVQVVFTIQVSEDEMILQSTSLF